MTQTQLKTLKIIIFSLLGITVLLGVGYLAYTWYQPLDQPLDLPTETSLAVGDTNTPEPVVDTPIPSITPSPTIEPVCGAPPTLNILISGVASNSYLYGLADAVRVVKVDFQTKKVTVLALPRDLWVAIPGLESNGITSGKLNQAYFYGTEGMGLYSGSGYGSGLLAETLQSNYGYRADRYMAVNLASFRIIINTLGGIDVYLPYDVYKKVNEKPVIFLRQGYHHLYGKDAEMLARNRITIGDFGRINNQSIILRALAQELLSPANLPALPALVENLRDNVKTDLSPDDISQLICLAGMIDYQEDIQFVTLPEELMDEQFVYDDYRDINTAALIGDEVKIRELLLEFQQGIWP
jgi:LCP family protein required for cell wall assembly